MESVLQIKRANLLVKNSSKERINTVSFGHKGFFSKGLIPRSHNAINTAPKAGHSPRLLIKIAIKKKQQEVHEQIKTIRITFPNIKWVLRVNVTKKTFHLF